MYDIEYQISSGDISEIKKLDQFVLLSTLEYNKKLAYNLILNIFRIAAFDDLKYFETNFNILELSLNHLMSSGLMKHSKFASTRLLHEAFELSEDEQIIRYLFDKLEFRNDFAIGIPILHRMVLTNPNKWYAILYELQPIWLKWFTFEFNFWDGQHAHWFKNKYKVHNAVPNILEYIFKDFNYDKDLKLKKIADCLNSSSGKYFVNTMNRLNYSLSFEDSFMLKNVRKNKVTIIKILATDNENLQTLVNLGLIEYLPENVKDIFVF